jgi:hypothetical protein
MERLRQREREEEREDYINNLLEYADNAMRKRGK